MKREITGKAVIYTVDGVKVIDSEVKRYFNVYLDERSAFERAFNLAVYNRENWIEKRNQRLLAYEERKNFYKGLAAELDGNLDFQLD